MHTAVKHGIILEMKNNVHIAKIAKLNRRFNPRKTYWMDRLTVFIKMLVLRKGNILSLKE